MPVSLVSRSLRHYWQTHLAVVAGVAAAVTVLSGALLVGASVRGSLRDLVLQRLGRTDLVVVTTEFFRAGLAEAIREDPAFAADFESVVPMVAVQGVATEQGSGRRASRVQVYGVDDRFWRFHGSARTRIRRRGAERAAERPARARARGRTRRDGAAPHPASLRHPARFAAWPQGRCRPDGPAHGGRCPPAGRAWRVLAPAAAGRGARGVRAARAPAAGARDARPCERAAGRGAARPPGHARRWRRWSGSAPSPRISG